MADLIDREKALEKLNAIKATKEARTCSTASMREAVAIGYAIEVLKRLPSEGNQSG